MPTPVTGELRRLASGFEARVRIDDKGTRKGFALVGLPRDDEAAARERCRAMAEIALRLRRSGHASQLPDLLKMAARARPGKPWEAILVAVDAMSVEGGAVPLSESARITVRDFGQQWRSGELHRKYPDHVREKDSVRDEQLARLYVDPIIGDRRVAELTLDDADEVMAKLPEGKAPATRRHVAQYVRRLLGLAVYPGRLRTSNPIPKGWLPRVRDAKAKECLYPDEDAALLACRAVPLVRRLAYGFLTREGMRTDELARLEWRDVDLERGRVDLDENKTDDPRAWDLDPGVQRALLAWRARQGGDKVPARERVFAVDGVPLSVARLAHQLRRDLARAGVTREKLFERSASRQPIRAHDLRATFVTIALATGHTETWVADRTGHKSSTMINRYRRKARTWKLGALEPLDTAIPELGGPPHERPTGPASQGPDQHPEGDGGAESENTLETELGGSPSKSAVLTYVRVRVPPSVPRETTSEADASSSAAERVPHEHGTMMGRSSADEVEAALARALDAATAAGRFDVVAAIVRELEARRLR